MLGEKAWSGRVGERWCVLGAIGNVVQDIGNGWSLLCLSVVGAVCKLPKVWRP